MSIQKKSLISTLQSTKKANIAKEDLGHAGSATPGVKSAAKRTVAGVKGGVKSAARRSAAARALARRMALAKRTEL